MANFDNTDRVAVGAVTQLNGGVNDDTISISSTFLLIGTTSGVIDGLGGTDTLNLSSSNLTNVAITGIENTNIINNSTQTIEASEIANLGVLALTGTAATNGGFIRLTGTSGDTADFSGLTLQDGEELTVSNTFPAGSDLSVDFSAGTFIGSAFIDYNGSIANETVAGGSGDDQISGGNGDDVLIGGLGNDSIDDSSGTNDLQGGSGDDTLVSSSNSGGTIDGGADNDEIRITNQFQNAAIDGGSGTDTLRLTSANLTGTTILGIESAVLANNGTLFIDADQVQNLGAITLEGQAVTNGGFVQLRGPSGGVADFSGLQLNGSEELTVSNNFSAGSALTVDFSGASFGGTSFVDYNGGVGNETVTGGTGDDDITGSTGDDVLIGGLGDDTISDNSGTNDLQGGGGDDEISASSNATGSIDAGADNDTVAITSNFMNGTIDGGTGTDTLNLFNANLTGTTISGIEATNISNNSTQFIEADQIENLGVIRLAGTAVTSGGAVQLRGSSGDLADFTDLELGGTEELTVTTVFGSGQDLTVDFSSGSFTGSSFVDYNGGSANETVFGGSGDDELTGSGGNDLLVGGLGNDLISDSSGNNDLQGGSGDDTVSSTSVATGSIDGGADNDTLNVSSNFIASTIEGGTGTDTLNLFNANIQNTTVSGVENTNISNNSTQVIDAAEIENLGVIRLAGTASSSGGNIQLRGNSGDTADFSNLVLIGTEELIITNNFGAGTSLTTDFSLASFSGSSFVDYNGGAANEVVIGGSANDELTGSSGNDTLIGGAGNDLINDTSGINDLQGGTGEDTITSSSNATGLIDGGADNDTINVSSTYTNATIDGGGGTDTLNLANANLAGTTITSIENTNITNNSTQTIDADQIDNLGALRLTGTAASNGGFISLQGASGDTADFSGLSLTGTQELRVSNSFGAGTSLTVDFSGGSYAGTSFVDYDGGSGNETVIGGSADDELSGNAGDDQLIGGLGNDLIVDNSGTNDLQGSGGDDTITSSSNASGSVDGGADNDVINISNTFTSAMIAGGSGTDTLNLASANLTGTTISGIEITNITNNGSQFIQAEEIANLGTINLTNTASSNNGLIQLRGASGDTADFSGLVLTGTEELRVLNNLAAGTDLTVDFSNGSFGGSSFINYDGSAANETVTGGTGDDDIFGNVGDDVLIGGLGNDIIVDGSGTNDLQGGAGNDTLTANSNATGSIDGGADNDTLNISNTYQNGAISGGSGTDTLILASANLIGTNISGIEATNINNNGTQVIDAAQIANLGDISLTSSGSSSSGNLQLRDVDGQTVDFANLTLNNDETFRVNTVGVAAETATIDFSNGTYGNNVQIVFNSSAVVDTVIASDAAEDLNGGFAGDRLSYEASDAGVTVDLLTNTVSGGFADGDEISGFDNITGSDFNDLFNSSTRTNDFDGGDGTDIVVFQGNRADYTIVELGGDTTVTDNNGFTNGFDSTVTTTAVEILRFADQDVVIVQPGIPQVSISGAPSLAEGDAGTTNFEFTITRSGVDLSAASSVAFAVTGNTADAGDFVGGVLPSGTVNFAAGETSQTLSIPVQGDTDLEGDETFTVTLSAPVNAEISGSATDTGTILDDDPLPTLSIASAGTFLEGDTGTTTFDFVVTRAGDLTGASSASFSVINSSTNADDFGGVQPSGTVSFAAGADTATISVDVTGDVDPENNEVFFVQLSAPTNATIQLASGFGTIENDDPFEPAIAISNATSQNEGDAGTTSFTFTVTRTGILTDPSSVDFAVQNAIVNAADFGGTLPSGTVNFAAGEDTADITIDVTGDTNIESDETFFVNLSNPTNGRIVDVQGTSVILNDDTSLPTLAIADAGSQREGDSGITAFDFTVTRAGDLSQASSATYTVSNAGGVNADDFGGSFPTGTVSFAAGVDTATITIEVTGDLELENNEAFIVTLSAAQNATFTDTVGSATIFNDDSALSIADAQAQNEGDAGETSFDFVVTRTGDLSEEASADYGVTGGDADALDFVGIPTGSVNFGVGEDTATITIDVAGDTDVEAAETFIVSLSNPTNTSLADDTGSATILNDDTSAAPTLAIADAGPLDEGDIGAATFEFTVTRSGDLTFASAAAYAVVAGDTDVADFGGALPTGTVNFAAGEDTAVISVDVSGDTDIEMDEDFSVVLSAPSNATLINAIGAATIVNDDLPPPPTLAIDDAGSQNEGNAGTTTFEFTVTRSGDLTAASSASYTIAAGDTDAADFGGTLPTGTVTFAAGEDTAVISIDVSGDVDVEADESFSVMLSTPTNATLTDDTGTATILNDDTTPEPTIAISDAGSQDEGDTGTTTFAFTVTRAGDLTAASAAAYAVVAGDTDAADFGGALPTGTVSFAAGEDTALINIDVTGDIDVEANEAFSVTLSAPTNATIVDAAGTATILNDDAIPEPTIAIADTGALNEGDAGSTSFDFTVTRTGDLTAASSAAYAVVAGDTNAADFGGTLPSGTVTFAAGEDTATISVDVSGDTDVELDETFSVMLSAPSNAVITDDIGTATILNDDTTNAIFGTTGMDFLVGTGEDERIDGLGGPLDQAIGGGGADTFVYSNQQGSRDVLMLRDYDQSTGDLLDLGGTDYASQQFGTSTYLFMDGADMDMIVLVGVTNDAFTVI